MKLATPALLAALGLALAAPVALAQTPGQPPQGRRMQMSGIPDSLRAQVRDRMMALPDTARTRIFTQLMQLPEDQRGPFLLRQLGLGAARPGTAPAAPAPAASVEAPAGPTTATNGRLDGAILRGVVRDSSVQEVFPGVTVKALRNRRAGQPESDTLAAGTVTDVDGRYALRVPAGTYRLRVESPGFRRVSRVVTVADGDIATFPAISLEGAGGEAGEIVVEGAADVVRVSGDTVSFRAESIRLAAGSTSEDLVRRVPGVTIENGQVSVRGERVTRVTVDGQEFFGNDAVTTLQSLPADLIRDVQVLDQASEQSRFSGFDDGNRERSINLVTRPDRRRGTFGRVSGGAAPEGRYIVDGAVNRFRGTMRGGVTFLTNNINQQQFAFEDLAASGSFEAFRGGGGGGMSMGGGGNFRFGPGGFATASDGEVATHALGLTLSDRTRGGTQWSLSAVGTANVSRTNSLVERLYAETSPLTALALDTSAARSLGQNVRLQGRLERSFTPRTQLTLTARLNGQNADVTSDGSERALSATDALVSRAITASESSSVGYAALGTALLRHRLGRPGRTVSLNLALGYNGSDREQTLQSNTFVRSTGSDSLAARRVLTGALGASYSATLSYTEPLARNTQLELSLSPSANWSDSDQTARLLDYVSLVDQGPLARYENDVQQSVNRQRAGAQVQHRWGEGWRFTAGLSAQREQVGSEQTIAGSALVDEAFYSVLPQVTLAFQPRGAGGGGGMGRMMAAMAGGPNAPAVRIVSGELSYRTNTDVPSVTQLGRVPDDTNPLRLTGGNAALVPSYQHELRARIFDIQPIKGNSNLLFVNYRLGQNYIGDEVILAGADTTLDGFRLLQGGTFTRPVNLDGQSTLTVFGNVGRGLGRLPLSASLGLNALRTVVPGRLNGNATESETRTFGGTLGLNTTRTRGWDGSLSYNASLSQTERTGFGALSAASQELVTHRLTGQVRARPGKFILETDLSLFAYGGDRAQDTPTQVFWNAALGYAFGGANPVELRLTATDLLDQANGFSRSFQPLFTRTSESNALGRYFMLRATWRFNSMTGGARAQTPGVPGMPGGGPVIIRHGASQ